MTVTYDPAHPRYYDEADLRAELNRVYDLCHGCRLCFNLCPAFPTLFQFIDQHDDQDVEKLTEAEQDRVVDECYQCKLCYVKCPYIPPHEWELDFPRLMLRAEAVRHKNRDRAPRARLANQFLGRIDTLGKVSSAAAPVVNRLVPQAPGSLPRRVMEKTLGVASDRLMPPFARQRFSTWFKKRGRRTPANKHTTVALFSTCLVEYQNPAIGHDLVKVYERNGVECELPEGQMCCGMPWLDGGDVDNFKRQAEKNVKVLARAVKEGKDIVVPQPTCAYALKKEYPGYIGDDDARLVGEHTYDAAEYLMKLRKDGKEVDTEFTGVVPESVTYHVACHVQAQGMGLKARDLLALTGAKVNLVSRCSGIDGTWGYRAEYSELSKAVAEPMVKGIEKHDDDVVMGDCHLANTAITELSGKTPVHPIQLVARAYGIPEEPT
ncbi:MAG: heterodisulfide reductase-related iron-sulfur binding cluster [Actinomycetota bacterium]